MIATKGPRRTKAVLPLTEEQRRVAEGCVGLAASVALKVKAASMDDEEKVGWGMIGLLDAVATYDAELHVKLETWVAYRVRTAILDASRSGAASMVKGSRYLNMSSDDALNMRTPLRIDALQPMPGTKGRKMCRLADSILAREPEDQPADMEAIWKAVRGLGERAAETFDLYYHHGWSMRRIGTHFGITESAVSMAIAAALAELRDDPYVRRAVAS